MDDKATRLGEFFRRLAKAQAVSSAEVAFRLVCDTLNSVEDEATGEPFDPSAWQAQERMYPPQEDSRFDVEGFPGVVRYRSRGHNTFVGPNGAIEIRDTVGGVLFAKPGADGRGIFER